MCIYTYMNISTFAALADPMRLRLVEELRLGELPVNDLVERVQIQQSGVSRHLAILARAGFVSVRPDGQRRLYSLRAEPFQEIDSWVMQFRAHWEARLDRLDAALEQRKAAASTRKNKTQNRSRRT
jgi:DNA-binding transcriptional ArsR family regulator